MDPKRRLAAKEISTGTSGPSIRLEPPAESRVALPEHLSHPGMPELKVQARVVGDSLVTRITPDWAGDPAALARTVRPRGSWEARAREKPSRLPSRSMGSEPV